MKDEDKELVCDPAIRLSSKARTTLLAINIPISSVEWRNSACNGAERSFRPGITSETSLPKQSLVC
jgi:hypothetical protein